MYCESAQRDCPYIEYVDNLHASTILIQTDKGEVDLSPHIRAEVEEVLEATHDKGICEEDRCGLIGMAIVNSVIWKATLRD